VRGLVADAAFWKGQNFRFPELYELIECGQVMLWPDAHERKPETTLNRFARGWDYVTFAKTSYWT
jgi:hypothetical protein